MAKLAICNSALILIGANTISSLDDGSKSANLCRAQYDRLRKETLRGHPWNFAVTRKALGKTTNVPVFGYGSEFTLPSDCLRILATDLPEGEPWAKEVSQTTGLNVLVCNSDSVKIKYIKDITDATLFSPDFSEAFAARLAAGICYALTQNRALMRDMFGVYKELISMSRSFDSQENSLERIEANEWIDVRA